MTPKTVAMSSGVNSGLSGLSTQNALVPKASTGIEGQPRGPYTPPASDYPSYTSQADYMPDVPSSQASGKKSTGIEGQPRGPFTPKIPYSGMAFRLAGGAGTVLGAVDALYPSFMAAMYLRRTTLWKTPSNWTHACGPLADAVPHVIDLGTLVSAGSCGGLFNWTGGQPMPKVANPIWTQVARVKMSNASPLYSWNFWPYRIIEAWTRTSPGAMVYAVPAIAVNLWTANFPDPLMLPMDQPVGFPKAANQPQVAGYGPPGAAPPSSPVATITRDRPPPGTREKKFSGKTGAVRFLYKVAGQIMNGTTEGCDAIEDIYDALPKEKQIKVILKRTKDGKVIRPGHPDFQKKSSKWIAPGCKTQLKHIYNNFQHIDWTKARSNMAESDAGDKVHGKTARDAQQSLNQGGWKGDRGIGVGPAL